MLNFTGTMRRCSLLGLLCFTGMLLSGCGGRSLAPVHSPDVPQSQAPTIHSQTAPATTAAGSPPPADGYHVVAKGDTLYSIAWRYGRDYRTVARWNQIGPPYLIYPGDRIRVAPPAQQASPPVAVTPSRQPSPPIGAEPDHADKPARAQPPKAEPPPRTTDATVARGPIDWQWPTSGELVRVKSPTAEKGIKIGGRIGQEISAAAPGQVVYSGSGLIGYGKLIIIKHNDTYLSAYAHNHELLVNEGDSVSAGQKIATMGTGGEGRALLHFEIRQNGQPVNPLQHLPGRKG